MPSFSGPPRLMSLLSKILLDKAKPFFVTAIALVGDNKQISRLVSKTDVRCTALQFIFAAPYSLFPIAGRPNPCQTD